MKARTAIDMSGLLAEMQVPDIGSALAFLDYPAAQPQGGLRPPMPSEGSPAAFAPQPARAAWDKSSEARCDFYPRTRLVHRAGFYFFALWQKSPMGRTLSDIKADAAEVPHFANATATLIREVVGRQLNHGGWAVVTTPKRRHLTRNFATLVAQDIARQLDIPFHEDVAACHSRQRINAEFQILSLPPEPNLILFDDFVTTGSTLKAMKQLLEQHAKNLLLFAGINNKL